MSYGGGVSYERGTPVVTPETAGILGSNPMVWRNQARLKRVGVPNPSLLPSVSPSRSLSHPLGLSLSLPLSFPMSLPPSPSLLPSVSPSLFLSHSLCLSLSIPLFFPFSQPPPPSILSVSPSLCPSLCLTRWFGGTRSVRVRERQQVTSPSPYTPPYSGLYRGM